MSEQNSLPDRGISIVPSTWRDLKSLRQLEKVCFALDAWPILDLIGVLSVPQVIRLKAIQEDRMIGFIAADLRRSQQTAWIATIGVLPGYQLTGIGSALLQACENQVDLPRIRLCVRQTNQPAISLYRKFGYQQVDIWKRYYKGGVNGLVFEKDLR